MGASRCEGRREREGQSGGWDRPIAVGVTARSFKKDVVEIRERRFEVEGLHEVRSKEGGREGGREEGREAKTCEDACPSAGRKREGRGKGKNKAARGGR